MVLEYRRFQKCQYKFTQFEIFSIYVRIMNSRINYCFYLIKMFSDTKNGVVDFGESFDQIKKKTVRGLLKKRAKQYDSDSDENEPK